MIAAESSQTCIRIFVIDGLVEEDEAGLIRSPADRGKWRDRHHREQLRLRHLLHRAERIREKVSRSEDPSEESFSAPGVSA